MTNKTPKNKNLSSAELQTRKTNRLIYGIAGAVMVLIVGSGVVVSKQNEAKSAPGKVNAQAVAPSAAFPASDRLAYGIPFGSNDAAPVLEVWEDFQCPACKAVEDVAGKNIRQLAETGQVRLVYRVVNFLDGNLRNDSSTRGAIAFGCAADQGVAADYHDTVYANQPKTEGAGYTDAAFTTFAKTSGLSAEKLATWQECFDARTYKDWVANSMAEFTKNKYTGTPTFVLNGTVLDTVSAVDPVKLAAAVAAAKK